MRRLLGAMALLAASLAHAQGVDWRASTPAESVLDAAAFQGVTEDITQQLTDVESVVVAWRGRVVYAFYRDGSPDTLRDTQSVQKSALSALVGIAIGQGRIAGLDQPVVELMPEWAGLNPDPRTATITVRHLLTLTAGFAFDDPHGNTGGRTPPETGWARPLAHAPGAVFGYDNALVPMLSAVLQRATGVPLDEYARQQLVQPLGMAEPSYRNGLHLRTIDMAKLGHLFLQQGAWDGRQLLPAAYVATATQAQNAGGPPVRLSYGLMWWTSPAQEARRTFFASGYGGQMIWVLPAQDLVVAATATRSRGSQERGQVLGMLTRHLLPAMGRRMASEPR